MWCGLKQGCTNPGRLINRTSQFLAVVLYVFGSSEQILPLLITILGPGILKWFLDFCVKSVHPWIKQLRIWEEYYTSNGPSSFVTCLQLFLVIWTSINSWSTLFQRVSYKADVSFFFGGVGGSVCYEETQNNKWTEPVSRQPQFNLRRGTEHRGKSLVWFSHRRPWVTGVYRVA